MIEGGPGTEMPLQVPADPTMGPAVSSGLDDPRALQILGTEHWSLLATRSLAYNEIFTRAAMFLTFLGASLVALGLISNATGFTSELALLAAIVLATDLFLGIATLGRIMDASQEEMLTVLGMNRIRHAYREMVPGIEPYFSTPFHDDGASVLSTYGVEPLTTRGNLLHALTTAPAMVGVVDAVLAGALAAVVALGVGASLTVGLIAGVIGFVVVFVFGLWVGFQQAFVATRRRIPRFPAPDRPDSR